MIRQILQLLLLIVGPITDAIRRHQRQQEEQQRQEKRDEVANDPAGSFANHFGRVSPKVPDDASDAKQAISTGGTSE